MEKAPALGRLPTVRLGLTTTPSVPRGAFVPLRALPVRLSKAALAGKAVGVKLAKRPIGAPSDEEEPLLLLAYPPAWQLWLPFEQELSKQTAKGRQRTGKEAKEEVGERSGEKKGEVAQGR